MGINKFPLGPANFRSREKKPLYARLQEQLQNLIESGYWKPNDRLPPERELAEATGISVNTIKTALHNMVLEGYLYRRQGSGTYVSSPESFFGVHRYYAMQKGFDCPLERHKKVMISRDKRVAPGHIGKHFSMGDNVEAFRLERLLYVSGIKTISTVSWLPCKLFVGFESIPDEDFSESSLYLMLATKFNLPCRISKELLRITSADAYLASQLAVAEATPLLYSQLIALSYLQHPVEVRESYILTDSFMLYREF